MSWGGEWVQPGLELLPDHDVATPTLVYCRSMHDYWLFLCACQVKDGVRNKRVKMLTDTGGPYPELLRVVPASWAHIAFVGIDPRCLHVLSSTWEVVDSLRLRRHFKRAFYYPEWTPAYIKPNVTEGEREW